MFSIVSQSATSPSKVYHEYELEGGVKVRDATDGNVKAEFSKIERSTGRRVYKILIAGHEIHAPTGAFALAFCGSDSLKFKEKGNSSDTPPSSGHLNENCDGIKF